MRNLPVVSWKMKFVLSILLASFPAVAVAAGAEVQVLERKELPGGLVRSLEKKPSEAKTIAAIQGLGGKVSVDEKLVPGTQSKILVETTTSDAGAQRRLVDLIVKELGKAGVTVRPDAPE